MSMDSTRSRDILRQVGRNIRAERARRDVTQEGLAHLAGIGISQIARMERGETDGGLTKYVAVAYALDIDPAVLLQGVKA